MYSNEEITGFVSLVAETTDPDRIVLFGSYAYGDPDDDSDLDLLVIKNDKDLTREEHADLSTAVYLARRQRNIRTRYDIFFRTDAQVREAIENGGAFSDAVQRGRVIYERVNQQESGAIL